MVLKIVLIFKSHTLKNKFRDKELNPKYFCFSFVFKIWAFQEQCMTKPEIDLKKI